MRDGSAISMTDKSCSTCPDPTFTHVDLNGNIVKKIKAFERDLVIESLVTPDDKYLITATSSGEGIVRIYDISTGRLIKQFRTPPTPSSWAGTLSVSSDASKLMIATGSKLTGQAESRLVEGGYAAIYDLTKLPSQLPKIHELKGFSDGYVEGVIGRSVAFLGTQQDRQERTETYSILDMTGNLIKSIRIKLPPEGRFFDPYIKYFSIDDSIIAIGTLRPKNGKSHPFVVKIHSAENKTEHHISSGIDNYDYTCMSIDKVRYLAPAGWNCRNVVEVDKFSETKTNFDGSTLTIDIGAIFESY